MAITDPQAIEFCNQYLRPLCEQVRAIKYKIDDAEARWFDGINTIVGTGSEVLDDGREALPPLTADDITNAIANLLSVRTAINLDVIELPCVRPLDVTLH